jgi:hypothetical protein
LVRDYKSAVFQQAVDYYRFSKLSIKEIRLDIDEKWPSQVDRTEEIIDRIQQKRTTNEKVDNPDRALDL